MYKVVKSSWQKESMAQNFADLEIDINLQIQVAQCTSSEQMMKKTTPRQIIDKLLKIKGKLKSFESSQGKMKHFIMFE